MAITERYVSSLAAGGGNGSVGSPWTLVEAFAQAVAGDRVNIKADGTYTLSATLTFGASGGVQPIIWRGYKTTIGDGYQGWSGISLVVTNMPYIDGGVAYGINVDKGGHIFDSLNINGALTGAGAIYFGVATCAIIDSKVRCARNTAGSGYAVCMYTQDIVAYNCDLASTQDSLAHASVLAITGDTVIGCVITSSLGNGIHVLGGATICSNIIQSCGNYGIYIGIPNSSTPTHIVSQNTIVDCVGAGIYRNGGNGLVAYFGNIITGCANARANSSPLPVLIAGNRIRDNTGADINIGDWPICNEITTDTGGDETDFVDAANGDYRLIRASPASRAGLFGINDIGACMTAWNPALNQTHTGYTTGGTGTRTDADPDNVVVGTGTYGADGTALTPAYVIPQAEQHSANEVIDTASVPGNFVVSTLSDAVILDSVESWGLTGAGAFSEADRNTIPDLSKIPTEATGGPASWKQLNVDRAGTMNLDATKLAFEAARNSDNGTVAADISVTKSVKIRNVTTVGTNDKLYSTAERNAYAVLFELARNDAADPSYVVEGYTFDQFGIPVVGTFDALTPAAPLLSGEDKEDGTGAVFAISGESLNTKNELFVAKASLTFTSKGYAWTGGQMDVALDAGLYICYVKSYYVGGSEVISNAIRVVVTDGEAAASDNLSLAKKVMKQTVVYWRRDDVNDDGQPTWHDPIEVPCRWDYDVAEVVTPQGETFNSTAKVIVDRDMDVGGVIMLGSFDDVTDEANPKENAEAWEIKHFKRTANIKGKKYLREAFV